MTALLIIFGVVLLIPMVAALMVIISLLGWTMGILVDAALAFIVLLLIVKILEEL